MNFSLNTLNRGHWSVTIPQADLNALTSGKYTISASATDAALNKTTSQKEIIVDLSQTAELDEADYKVVVQTVSDGAGNFIQQSVISYPTVQGQLAVGANTTVKLIEPTNTTTTFAGKALVWSVSPDGYTLTGTIAGETSPTFTVTINSTGAYQVIITKGADHLSSDLETVQIPFELTNTNGTTTANLNVVIHDDVPVTTAPITVDLTQAGIVEGQLVESFGIDGGHLQAVTIEGNTYVYDAVTNTVKQYGTSANVYAYSYSSETNSLVVTTVHGNTVTVNMQTGAYAVAANGITVTADTNVAPDANLGNKGGLLGTANVNVAGLIDLSSSQLYTVSDENNNITKVVINKAALLNLDLGLHYEYSAALAAEFGFDIKTIPAVLITPAQITITSKNGVMDVDRLNEFLGTVKLVSGLGQVLDVKLLAGESITATDQAGLTGKDTTVNLADVGVLAGLGELIALQESGIRQEGTSSVDVVTGDQSTLSKDDRLYGYAGDDLLLGLTGNDLLRGGAGKDNLDGGIGSDILIGGTGNDVLIGGDLGSIGQQYTDVFKWEVGDQKAEAGQVGVTRDTVIDFNIAAVRSGGDILDLSGLLIGEGRIGSSTGNLTNYLHFVRIDNGDGTFTTEIHISTAGNYIGGYSAAVASNTDQIIVLVGVDLVAKYGSDQQIISELINSGKLIVDSAQFDANALTDQNINISAEVIDGDGDRVNTGISSVDTSNIPDQSFDPNNIAPITQAKVGSLLGLINLDTLGVINLSDQYLTAYDENENLQKVEIKYQPIITVSLTPLELHASQTLAAELGLQFTLQNDDGVLGLIAPSSTLTITAIGGGKIDNLAINELLASIYLTAQNGTLLTGSLLNLDVINSINITATDTQGASSSSSVADLLGVNLLNTQSFNSAASKIYEGDQGANTMNHSTSTESIRIYGMDGDDIISSGSGDDLIRGGNGVDTIDAGVGDDLILGGAGNDLITGGTGADTVIFELLTSTDATGGNGKDTWTDFHVGNITTDTEADKIDISSLLIGFDISKITSDLDASVTYLKDYLSVSVVGDNVSLKLDRDGTGTAYTAKVDLLQLDGLAATGAVFNSKSEDDILKLLLQNHQLVL